MAKSSYCFNKDSMRYHALTQDWSDDSCTRRHQLENVVMCGIAGGVDIVHDCKSVYRVCDVTCWASAMQLAASVGSMRGRAESWMATRAASDLIACNPL